MEYIGYTLLAGFIISLASISGVVLVKSHKKIAQYVEENLKILGSLSGGIFLVTSVSLGYESLEVLNLAQAVVAFLIGIAMYLILQKVTTSHRHIGESHSHDHSHDKKSALKILIGDAIHNVADGLLLVASFGVSSLVGISTAFSIFLHETPQEISEFIVLRKSGYTTTEAAYKNFATALSIFIGIAIGFVFLKTQILQGYLLGISASFFIGIIFTDLFPLKNIRKQKDLSKIITSFIIGILFMLIVSKLLGHSH